MWTISLKCFQHICIWLYTGALAITVKKITAYMTSKSGIKWRGTLLYNLQQLKCMSHLHGIKKDNSQADHLLWGKKKKQVGKGLLLLCPTLDNTVDRTSGFVDKISLLSECESCLLGIQMAPTASFILLHVCWHQMIRDYKVAESIMMSVHTEYDNICTVDCGNLIRLFEARGDKPRGCECLEF